MINFNDFCKNLLEECGYKDFEYDDVISFTQTFSSTACGRNGLAGQSFTNGQVFIFTNYKNEAIVIGPGWSYFIKEFTATFVKDIHSHYIAVPYEYARLKQYGSIKCRKIY